MQPPPRLGVCQPCMGVNQTNTALPPTSPGLVAYGASTTYWGGGQAAVASGVLLGVLSWLFAFATLSFLNGSECPPHAAAAPGLLWLGVCFCWSQRASAAAGFGARVRAALPTTAPPTPPSPRPLSFSSPP